MKTSALVVGQSYGLTVRNSDYTRAALVLDDKPWLHGERTVRQDGSLVRVFELVHAEKQRVSGESLYTDPQVGIPVLVLAQSALRWYDDRPADERIITPAGELLYRAHDMLMLAETVVDQTQAPHPLMKKVQVVAETASGKKIGVDVELMLVRPQHILAPWQGLLEDEQVQRREALRKIAQVTQIQTNADVLDVQTADRLDKVLGPVTRLEYNGLRPDVVRRRGEEVFQVDIETFLRLLELAERHDG